jgi:hypothetical protein
MAIENDAKFDKVVAALKSGQFDDQPEIKNALATEAATYKQGREQVRLQDFSGKINTDPVENVSIGPSRQQRQSMRARGIELPADPTQGNPSDALLHNNAANSGVDISTGAPASLRASADLLALKPDAKIAALEYLVAQDMEKAGVELPPGVSAVFKEDFTGKLAYWQPMPDGSLKPTLLNGFGLDAGDALSALDDAVQIGLEIPAAIGGAAAGAEGGPVGAAAGGAAAVGAVNAGMNVARKEIARSMGIPDEIVDQIDGMDIFTESLLAAGFETAGPVAAGLIRRARNLGRPLDTKAGIEQLKKDFDVAMRASRELEEQTGVKITPTLGQASGDPELLVIEANVQRDAFGNKGKALREEEVRNRASTGEAIRRINDNAVPTGPRADIDVSEQGTAAKDVVTRPRVREEDAVARAEQDQIEQLDEVADLQYRDRWASTQEDLRTATEAAKKRETKTWNVFRKQIEYDPKTRVSNIQLRNVGTPGEPSPINAAFAQIHNDSKGALSDSLRASQANLIEDLGYRESDDFIAQLAAPNLDVNQLHNLLSHLKHQARKEDAGTGLGWRGSDITTMVNAIETQLKEGTFQRVSSGRAVNPAKAQTIRDTFKVANDASVTKHGMFDNKAVKELYRQNSAGEFIKSPNATRKLVFKPGNAEPLRDVLRVVGNNPAKVAGLTDELNIMYKSAVINSEGKFSRSASNNFLSEFNDHIRLLTGKDSTDFIQSTRDFDRVANKARAKATKVEGMLSRAYGKKLTGDDIYSGTIASDMLNDQLSVSQIRNIKNTVGRSEPDLWRAIQAAGLEEIENQLLKAGGREANAAGIKKLLTSNRGRLQEIYGPQYVKNLDLMQDMMNTIERAKLSRASKVVMNPPWLQVGRSVFGPLSPIQRRLTAGTKLRKSLKDASLYNLMSNPQKLDSFVKLNKLKPGTIGYIQAAQAAGIGLSDLDPDSQETAARVSELRAGNPRSKTMEQLKAVNDRRGRDASAVR